MAVAGRAAGFVAVAAALSFGLSLWLTRAAEPWAFFSFPTRAWQLATGALVALAAPALRRLPSTTGAALGWLGLAAIAWATVGFSPATTYPGTAAFVPTLGAAAVIAGGNSAPRGPGRFLSAPPLQAGGHISYTTYLGTTRC